MSAGCTASPGQAGNRFSLFPILGLMRQKSTKPEGVLAFAKHQMPPFLLVKNQPGLIKDLLDERGWDERDPFGISESQAAGKDDSKDTLQDPN
jgi:hypothetical protein